MYLGVLDRGAVGHQLLLDLFAQSVEGAVARVGAQDCFQTVGGHVQNVDIGVGEVGIQQLQDRDLSAGSTRAGLARRQNSKEIN